MFRGKYVYLLLKNVIVSRLFVITFVLVILEQTIHMYKTYKNLIKQTIIF